MHHEFSVIFDSKYSNIDISILHWFWSVQLDNLCITVFYNTLKLNHIILYHIWYLLHDEPTVLYIFQNTSSVVSSCCIEFNHYKTRIYCITVFYCTLKRTTSFCIIFDICYMMNLPFYIYSRILPVLISACRIEFNHYKMWIYSIIVFYNTLKHNRIILYNIWYLQHDATTVLYIFQYTPSVDLKMLYWI